MSTVVLALKNEYIFQNFLAKVQTCHNCRRAFCTGTPQRILTATAWVTIEGSGAEDDESFTKMQYSHLLGGLYLGYSSNLDWLSVKVL